MLFPQGIFRTVSAHRYQTKQGIQVEAGQCAAKSAKLEVPLGEQWLCGKGKHNSQDGDNYSHGSA